MSILKIRGLPPVGKNELVILDRDGTLNIDSGYTFKLNEMQLLKGVINTLSDKRFKNSIFAIASNQAGISKGIFSVDQSINFTEKLCQTLECAGIQISAFAFCPHDDYSDFGHAICEFRKPNSGMLISLINLFDVSKESTIFVGNSKSDETAALNVNVKFIRVHDNFPNIGEFS
jgi:D,D-heptose 1,7-bisphosphate phosphatase